MFWWQTLGARRLLARDGFVVLRKHLSRELLAGALDRAMALRSTEPKVRCSMLFDDQEALVTPTIRALAADYLGHAPETHFSSLVRFQTPTVDPLPYHQDQTLISRPLFNLWAPLTPAGGEYPGLELVRGSHAALAPTDGDPKGKRPIDRLHIAPLVVREAYRPADLIAPALAPGDAILFTGRTIHRTHVGPNAVRERISIEQRLV